jgi:hypothetical protein
MPAPVITRPLSPRRIAQGAAITIELAASGSPTSWAATGLPAGLAIDTTTGEIDGAPLAPGQTTASITATNGDGTSDPAQIIFVVEPTPPGAGGPLERLLDWELTTGLVRVPGIEPGTVPPGADGEGAPWVMHLKRGDRKPVLVGLLVYGVLQDVGEEVDLKLALKEFEPERLIELNDGTATRVGDTPDTTRYRIEIDLDDAGIAALLGDYEGDGGTVLYPLAELQLVADDVVESSETFRSRLERDLIVDTTPATPETTPPPTPTPTATLPPPPDTPAPEGYQWVYLLAGDGEEDTCGFFPVGAQWYLADTLPLDIGIELATLAGDPPVPTPVANAHYSDGINYYFTVDGSISGTGTCGEEE